MKTQGEENAVSQMEKDSVQTRLKSFPSPLSTNEFECPFKNKQNKKQKSKAPKDKNLLLFTASTAHRFTVERRVWKKRMIFYKGQTAHLTLLNALKSFLKNLFIHTWTINFVI